MDKAKNRPGKAADKEQPGGCEAAGPAEDAPAPKGKRRKVTFSASLVYSARALHGAPHPNPANAPPKGTYSAAENCEASL